MDLLRTFGGMILSYRKPTHNCNAKAGVGGHLSGETIDFWCVRIYTVICIMFSHRSPAGCRQGDSKYLYKTSGDSSIPKGEMSHHSTVAPFAYG